MAILDVRKIGHVTFSTPDLQRLSEYYTDVMGLTLVDRTRERVYLASTIDHHSIVLEHGDSAECKALSFQVSKTTDLLSSAKRLAAMGVKATLQTDAEPGIGASLHLTDPKGTSVTVFAECDAGQQGYARSGIVPNKLGHVAYNVLDVRAVVDWYVDVLGFRKSDWIDDFFVFLRCGPDHHTINILRGEKVKMHHIAFELSDWAHIQRACDILSQNSCPLVWGPGRHGIGHNIFTYHHNPDGQLVELFTQLDIMADEKLNYFEPRPWHRDRPQSPKSWAQEPISANLWGGPEPEGFLR